MVLEWVDRGLASGVFLVWIPWVDPPHPLGPIPLYSMGVGDQKMEHVLFPPSPPIALFSPRGREGITGYPPPRGYVS